MNNMDLNLNLESKIEGLLFYKGEDISISKIASFLEVTEEDVSSALTKLEESLSNRGVTLIRKEDRVMLGISAELSPLIESIRKEEMVKELSKASLETLSIILYKDGVSRSEIDYIRGVNSSFIVRNLLVRGLIEKSSDERDSRKYIYKPTFDTLSYMGVTSVSDLPNYEKVRNELEETIKQEENNND